MKSEHQEQSEFVMWFRQTFRPVRIFAIPNGGHRHKATAMKLKVEGVSSGVPDLCIPAWDLWVEMKRSDGTPSDIDKNQAGWIEYLETIGAEVIVGYGCENAKEQVLAFCSKKDFTPKFN